MLVIDRDRDEPVAPAAGPMSWPCRTGHGAMTARSACWSRWSQPCLTLNATPARSSPSPGTSSSAPRWNAPRPRWRGGTARPQADPASAPFPVVLLSADATPGQIERLRTARAEGNLTEPIDVAQLPGLLDRRVLHAAGTEV